MGQKDEKFRHKKTLVISLDEVLVHSKFGRFEDCDKFISFSQGAVYYAISIYKRPYLDEFLEYVFETVGYEVIFYTSAITAYANEVLDLIDPQKRAIARLFRDS